MEIIATIITAVITSVITTIIAPIVLSWHNKKQVEKEYPMPRQREFIKNMQKIADRSYPEIK